MKRVFPVIKRVGLIHKHGEWKDTPRLVFSIAELKTERLSRARRARKLAERKQAQIRKLKKLASFLLAGSTASVWIQLVVSELEEEVVELLRVAEEDEK